ncbi:MAG: DUF1549 domain-containing protein [Thermoanaerobaculia bacterium]
MRRLAILGASVLLLAATGKDSCPYLTTATTVAQSSHRRAVAPAPSAPGVFPPTVNFIDADLFAKMRQDGVVPTTLSGDEEFLRRVTLDLTGAIPDPATVDAFLKNPNRAAKIDALLNSDAFVDRWTMWFGDLVQNATVSANIREYYLGRNAYYNWIKGSIRDKKPYDRLVRDVVAGAGDNFVAGEANYVVRQIQPNGPIQDTYDNLAAHSGEKFLGMQLLCLSCHSGAGHLELVNQSLRNRTRYDFWGMAAFFSKTKAQRQNYTDPANPNATLRKFMVQPNAAGAYLLNTTDGNKSPRQPQAGQSTSVPPVYMFTGESPRPGEDYRQAYGRMLTADRQFARAAVNYLWKEMFAHGIVEPANAFDLARLDPANLPPGQTLQPSNPQLLEDLTTAFIASGYDLRSILKTMALSSAYQLSSRYTPGAWNEAWTSYFARHNAHRLPAETMLDAITSATGVPVALNVQGIGTVPRAMQLPDTLEPGVRNAFGQFLNEFGRGDRDTDARTNDSSISQALSMLNNTIVTSRIKRSNASSTVAKVLASTSDPATIVDQLYLATLSRHATAAEKTEGAAYLRSGTLGAKAEDLQFALLNSLEFLFD